MQTNKREINQSTNQIRCTSPSNIAIIKYWGKRGLQKPLNPSISFSLTEAVTETTISYSPISKQRNEQQFSFKFDGEERPQFIPKLKAFFERTSTFTPSLKNYFLHINSRNTFPHSSGIASSASSMSALALAISIIEQQITGHQITLQTSSNIARLGSGSAARSLFPGWTLWGKCKDLNESSDHYAIDINNQIHPDFKNINDSILILHSGEKKVSSSMGHNCMVDHPFSEARIQQANKNTTSLLKALKEGDFNQFAHICEEEAMSLHALMVNSSPPFTLLLPQTWEAIERIQKYRNATGNQLCYTLDAGPNIHLLYPEKDNMAIQQFINAELKPLCADHQILYDKIGPGPIFNI